MQAIEFTYESHDDVIKIPESYKDWFKKPVTIKVILLAPELSHKAASVSPIKQNAWLGCMSGTGQIIGDIVSPLDDNLSSWEVLAK